VTIFDGAAEKAIDWGERALSLSPLDPMSYAAHFSIALGRLVLGEPEAAAEAAQKAVQANPYWSSAHFALAAAQAVLGRQAKAEAAARRVLELEPGFTVGRMCAAFDVDRRVAEPLSAALIKAGLPA